MTGTVALTRVKSASAETLGRGYEVERAQTYRDEDRALTVTWPEQVLVMQSTAYARAQETNLRARLATARTWDDENVLKQRAGADPVFVPFCVTGQRGRDG